MSNNLRLYFGNNDLPFCWCCPAVGLDFEKNCFFSNLLEKHDLPFLYSLKAKNTSICLDLSIGSMLERLLLKNAETCTSQRLKRTSGGRVMIIFGRSIDRSDYGNAWLRSVKYLDTITSGGLAAPHTPLLPWGGRSMGMHGCQPWGSFHNRILEIGS